MRKTTLFLLPLSLLLMIGFASCEKRPDADNTARNPAKPNAGDESETEADREITANIRKAVVADDSLSINAQNVKIISVNGVVTLRGPVKSEKEKMTIETKAKQAVGVKSVNNLIAIEANQ